MASETFLSIDVECVATGCGHLGRTSVSVTVVNMNEAIFFDEKIHPECVVHNYLTELTGFNAEDFVGKRNLAEVMVHVRLFLGPNVVLVGQGIGNDIRCLQLVKGTDYKRFNEMNEMHPDSAIVQQFESYPRSYSTILETIQRCDGRFDPHENYDDDDDYDNLYGDFYGNSGGKN